MFPLPSLYLKLAGAAIVALIIGWHFWGDYRVNHKLAETQEQLVSTQHNLKVAEENLIAATKARDEYLKAGQEAEAARVKIKADLQVTLTKLKKQKPPVECKAAIDWAVQNKDDLKWEAQ